MVNQTHEVARFLPQGVSCFEPDRDAFHQIIMMVYGPSKTGKSHLVLRAPRPLYLVYMDPNPAKNELLTKAQAELPGEVFHISHAPIDEELLTKDVAEKRLKAIEQFAQWAKSEGKGGTFVVDGAYNLLGYMQKAEVGASPILGFRPKPGEKAPRQVQYGAASSRFRDFISSLALADFDVIMTWEAREVYKTKYDRMGNETGSERTGKFRSTWPKNIEYSVTAMLETMLSMDGDKTAFKFQIGPNAHEASLVGRTLKACSFAELKQLLMLETKGALDLLDPEGTKVERVSAELVAMGAEGVD